MATRTSSASSRTRSPRLDPAAQPEREARWRSMIGTMDDALLAHVERVVRLTPTIVEVIVRAPAAARHFHPGQFYRLQNFERLSPHVDHGRSSRGAVDGRHCAHRRLGRSRTGPAVAHHAGDGRVEPAVRLSAAGRAGRRHGPDGNADRDSRAARACSSPAAAWATPCCSRSPRRSRRKGTPSSTSPASRTATTCSSARKSRRTRIR